MGKTDAMVPAPRYRVFVSYSHRDHAHVREIVAYLQREGLDVLWTENIRPGDGFTDQIQRFISLSHLCLVFLTPSSNARGWVQQEIGYARALKVPVLPLTAGVLPKGLIEFDQAIRLDKQTAPCFHSIFPLLTTAVRRAQRCVAYDTYLKRWINPDALQAVRLAEVIRDQVGAVAGAEMGIPSWRHVQNNADRVRLLGEYAQEMTRLGQSGMVRQKSGLTSFQTPLVGPNDTYFHVRYESRPKDYDYRRAICNERKFLTDHAAQRGTKLIINPGGDYSHYGPHSKEIRLEQLIAFLEEPDHPHVSAVVIHEANPRESLTLVGDWFSATSVEIQLAHGFRQTVFCTHAPTVTRQMAEFDQQFDLLLQRHGIPADAADAPARSRQIAVRELSDILNQTATHAGESCPQCRQGLPHPTGYPSGGDI